MRKYRKSATHEIYERIYQWKEPSRFIADTKHFPMIFAFYALPLARGPLRTPFRLLLFVPIRGRPMFFRPRNRMCVQCFFIIPFRSRLLHASARLYFFLCADPPAGMSARDIYAWHRKCARLCIVRICITPHFSTPLPCPFINYFNKSHTG